MTGKQAVAMSGLVLLGALVIIGGLLWSRRDVDVVLQHPPLDVRAWDAYTAELKGTPPPTGAMVDAVRAAFREANRAEVAAGPIPNKSVPYLGAVQQWEQAAWTLAQGLETRTYFQLGRWEGLRLIEALDDFLTHCAGAGLAPIPCLEGRDPPEPVRAYIDAGGAFVRFAAKGGFIQDGKLVSERIPLMQAVFLQHWGGLLRQRINVHAHFTPQELRWLLRWRVEWQSEAPVDARVEAAEQLRSVPDYPADLNAGALLFQAGRFADAAKYFERVDTPLGHKWLRAARARVEQDRREP